MIGSGRQHRHRMPPGEETRAARTLVELRAGEHGVIVAVTTQDTMLLQKLAAFGALPGARIIVEQSAPSILFRIGHTQVAVDATLAREIVVQVTAKR